MFLREMPLFLDQPEWLTRVPAQAHADCGAVLAAAATYVERDGRLLNLVSHRASIRLRFGHRQRDQHVSSPGAAGGNGI